MITLPQTVAGSAFKGLDPTVLNAMSPFTTSMQQMAAKAMAPYNERIDSLMKAATAPMRAQVAAILEEANRPLALKVTTLMEEAMRPAREHQAKIFAELLRPQRTPLLDMLREANSMVDAARAATAFSDVIRQANAPLLAEAWRINRVNVEVANDRLDTDTADVVATADPGIRSVTPLEAIVFVCVGALLCSAWLVSIRMTSEERFEFWVEMLLPIALSAAIAVLVNERE